MSKDNPVRWSLAPAREAYASVAASWDRLNGTLRDRHPLLDTRFVGPLVHHFAGSQDLLARFENNGDSQFVLCSPRKPLMWASFLPSQEQIAPCLLSSTDAIPSLMRSLPGQPIAFELYCQDPLFSPYANTEARAILHFTKHAVTTNIELRGDFATYWAGRSKKLRQNISRYERRAAAEIGPPRMNRITDWNGMPAALKRYGDIESSGWKGKAGTAVHIDNAQGSFYQDVLSRFAATGHATIYELYLGDILVASRLTISNDTMLVMLKTTYDETLAKYAPGRILLYTLLQNEFESQRFKSIEFYTNAAPELVTWSTTTRVISHVTVYRNSLLNRLSHLYRAAKQYRQAALPAAAGPDYDDKPETLSVERHREFNNLPASGAKLLRNAANASLFLTSQWFDNFVRYVATGDGEIRIYVAKHGNGKATGLLPMWLKNETIWLKVRVLHSLANYYSALFSLVSDAAAYDEEDTIAALVRAICEDAPEWDMLTITPVAADAPFVRLLSEGFTRAGMVVSKSTAFVNWYTPVDANGFQKYLAQRPSQLRHTSARKRRKLLREHRYSTKIYTELDGLDRGITDYEKVYRASWKRSEPYPDFIRGLIRVCAENKWLRLGILYVDEQAVAAQIWIVHNKTASIYKLAFHPDYARYSVGTVLSMDLMEHVIEQDRVEMIDFLSGDDPYKESWMSQKRDRITVQVFNPHTAKGKLLIGRRKIGDAVRNTIRWRIRDSH